jgi:alkyl hydroperoxide reductase subunit F
MMSKVTVYSTQYCQYCRMAKAFLEKNGIPYETIDVGADRVAAEKMIKLSGQRGVPVITVDDEVIVGFDSQRLNELFGKAGKGGVYDVLIVGAGPAGLTAGMYCARKMFSTLIISENIGGQALQSWAIENYMGYRMVTGEDLMKKFEEQVRTQDIRLELDRATGFSESDRMFRVATVTGHEFLARTLILRRESGRESSMSWGRSGSSGAGSRSAPPATGRCLRAKRSRLSVAETLPSRPQSR